MPSHETLVTPREHLPGVTVLFTDLVHSSQIYEALGNARALEIVSTHFKLLGDVLARHGGALIKTMGDAVFASFREPADAVRCARDMHESLRANAGHRRFYGWPVRIRAGVHFGDGLLVDGDIFGDTVNIASRVVALAEEDEVVCTGDVMARLPADLAANFEFLAPVMPRGILKVLEVHRWRTHHAHATRTMIRPGEGELTPGEWRFDPPGRAYAVVIQEPDGRRHVRRIGADTLLVGREGRYEIAVGVEVKSALVSRPHAGFRIVRDRLWIFDTGSRNGVFVRYPGAPRGEMRVKDQAPLTTGTQGRLGDCVFECLEGSADVEDLLPGGTVAGSSARGAGNPVAEPPLFAGAPGDKPASYGGGKKSAAMLSCGRCRKSYWASPFDVEKVYRCPKCLVSLEQETLAVDDENATRPILPPPLVDEPG